MLLFAVWLFVEPSPAPIPVPIDVSNSGLIILVTAFTGLVTALGAIFVGYLSHRGRMRELELEAEALRDERADRRRHNYGPPDEYDNRRRYFEDE